MNMRDIFKASYQPIPAHSRVIWAWIALFVLVKDWYTYLSFWPNSLLGKLIFALFEFALLAFILAAALRANADALLDRPAEFKQVLAHTWQRFSQVLLAFLIYAALATVLYYIAYGIGVGIYGHNPQKAGVRSLIIVALCGLPMLFLLVRFFFVLPLIVLRDCRVHHAFCRSFSLVKDRWLKTLILYIIFSGILVLTSPDTLHGHFMAQHYLNAPFDFIVLSVTGPLFLSMWTLSLQSLEQEGGEEGSNSGDAQGDSSE